MSDLINKASLQLREIIMDALGALTAEEAIPAVPVPAFGIEIPSDKSHGDFAANTAMVCAKAFRMNPRQIADLILGKLNLDGTLFDRAETAGPGFLNFFLSRRWFSDVVRNVLDKGDDYGKTDFGAGKRVLVEFVSANPTGPMHIGNARGGAIGDCLASVLNAAGYEAKREFYVNDAGNQIEKFGKSLSLRYMQICSDNGQKVMAAADGDTEKLCADIYAESGEGQTFEMPEDVYLGTDIIEHAANYYAVNGNSLADVSEEDRKKALVDYALPLNIAGLERDLKKYRIVYDIDKDFVLRRSNGLYTYIVPDIAYHYDKLVTRGFDKAINVLGADHHGYVPRLKAALSALGVDADRLDVVLMQMVRLVRKGEVVKLSKRSGKAITLVTLLDEIPIDAARFYFNLREANSQFEFDLDLAVEQSSQNPVYYVQYAHARICSLLRNLESEGISVPQSADLDLLSDQREAELIRHLASLPGEINLAAKCYDPAKLTKYAIDLATLFHRFYDACSVKNAASAEIMNARILLCTAVRQTLRNVLAILNINMPEKM